MASGIVGKPPKLADGGEVEIATSPASRERFYLPALDTLRFFAFLCVFVSHLPFILTWQPAVIKNVVVRNTLAAGVFGVDLFFTLSAYLITRLLLQERASSGKIHVLYFYIRRALRIWPLYFFFLAFGSVLLYFDSAFRFAALEPKYLLLLAIFVGNFAPANWMGSAYVLNHLWSVSVEEQFYLCWPTAIRGASERGIKMTALGLLIVASLARVAAWLAGASLRWIWTCTFTRLDPFAVGILLGTVPYARVTSLRSHWRLGLLLAGFVAWGFAAYFEIPRVPKEAHIGLLLEYPLAAAGSGAFLLATLSTAGKSARFMTNRWLVYLGRISYGLYVYHLFVMVFTNHYLFPIFLGWFQDPPMWVGRLVYVSVSFSLTVFLAAVSYRWLESPFLKLKSRFTYVESRPV